MAVFCFQVLYQIYKKKQMKKGAFIKSNDDCVFALRVIQMFKCINLNQLINVFDKFLGAISSPILSLYVIGF